MVQKASEKRTGRGRPPKFDKEHVIHAAIWAFFANGFENTTLAHLEDATGVDRSTLYNSFGGKAGLYHSATNAYLDLAEAGLFEPLLVGTDDGYRDIHEFLSRLRSGLTSPTAIPGCLIVNDMGAGADPEAAKRYRGMLEEGVRRALTRAGETDAARLAARALVLSASVLGVNLVSKTTGGDTGEIARLVDGMENEVRDWSVSG